MEADSPTPKTPEQPFHLTGAEERGPDLDAARFRFLCQRPDWRFIEEICLSITFDSSGEFLRRLRAAIDERMAKPQHPFGDLAGSIAESPLLGEVWMAFGQYEEKLIALPEYAAASAQAVGEKIMERARREGYRGSLRERMESLGWSVRRVRLEG